jgi:hypothetical protein
VSRSRRRQAEFRRFLVPVWVQNPIFQASMPKLSEKFSQAEKAM